MIFRVVLAGGTRHRFKVYSSHDAWIVLKTLKALGMTPVHWTMEGMRQHELEAKRRRG